MAPVWFLTTPAFGEPTPDQAEQSEVAVDSDKLETETPIKVGDEGEDNASAAWDILNTEVEKKESNSLGLLGLIFGVLGVAAAGFVWYDSRKKISALQTLLNGRNDLEIQSALNASQAKVEELNKCCNRLNTDYTYLKKDFDELVGKLNKKFQNPNNGSNPNDTAKSQEVRNSSSGNGTYGQSNNHRVEQKPALQTTYVSSLSIDDRGEYSIPMYSLEPGNTQALFKVLLDPQKGEGTYELNPNINNISVYMDTLKMFADGLLASKTSGYKTLVPGKLKRDGGDLKVVTKLQIG